MAKKYLTTVTIQILSDKLLEINTLEDVSRFVEDGPSYWDTDQLSVSPEESKRIESKFKNGFLYER